MNEQTEAVQRMQNYIDEHLNEEITLADLARASYFSPWYSHRLFARCTGLTPADYIRKLRLSRSAIKLRDRHCKIADVAFETGFGSVDGYTRAFYREFGRNPKEYADNPAPIYLFIPYGVNCRSVERRKQVKEVKTVFVRTVEKPARKVLIKRGTTATEYFTYCEEVGCDVWGLLQSIRSISGEPVSMWLPKRLIKPGTSRYVQGVELGLDSDIQVPQGFDVIELPAAKYLMFQGEPFAEEDYCDAIEEVRTSIEKYDPKLIGCAWDEENPRIQLEPIGERGYIELLPIS